MTDSVDLGLLCEPDITNLAPVAPKLRIALIEPQTPRWSVPVPISLVDIDSRLVIQVYITLHWSLGYILGPRPFSPMGNWKHSAPLGRMLQTVCNRSQGPVASVKALSILLHLVIVQNLHIINYMQTTDAGLQSKRS
jgi:hypothetical protein